MFLAMPTLLTLDHNKTPRKAGDRAESFAPVFGGTSIAIVDALATITRNVNIMTHRQ